MRPLIGARTLGELDVERALLDPRLGRGERGSRRAAPARSAGRHWPATRRPLRAGGGARPRLVSARASSLRAVATPARASASAAVNGRGSMVKSSCPCRTMAPSREVDGDDLARDARAHLDAAARFEPADIIVPLVDVALEGCRDRHRGERRSSGWGGIAAPEGDGRGKQRRAAFRRARRAATADGRRA